MTPFVLDQLSPVLLAGAACLAFLVAALVVIAGRRYVRGWVAALDLAHAENRAALESRARGVVLALAVAAFGIAAITAVSVMLGRMGLDVPDWTPRQIVSWILSHGIRALIIVAGAYVTLRVAHLSIERFQSRAAAGAAGLEGSERRRRAATLASIVSSLATALVIFLGGLMVLRELSIDVVPLLTGAGIAGLAIGFGAQNLVRDVISGFFIILEDQVGVGDVARIQSVTGVVEEVRLRTVVLRDVDGAVHVFPNGTITTLANLGKGFAYGIADVVVMHGEHLDRVFGALRMIGAAMQQDPEFAPMLLGPLEVLGVQELRDANLTIRVRFKTLPLKQWAVAAELRRRIAIGFAGRGIRPFRTGLPPSAS
jgi:moderate conductance mechanosensitive channel